MRCMRKMLFYTIFFVSLVFVNCEKPKKEGKEPDPKHVREWMSAETDFYKLEQELKKALGDEWDSFRMYMAEKIQEHHSMQQQSCSAMAESAVAAPASPRPYDDCNGQAGLTESEFILHQALDIYAGKIGDGSPESVHRYHNMAHNVFERTRKLLEKMSLLQGSEYEDAAVTKQNDMKFRYKRMAPIVMALDSSNNITSVAKNASYYG